MTGVDIEQGRLRRIGPFVYPHFEPVLPELVSGRDPQRHRVVIVGGGPVGMTTALGLARHGVPSVIIEADDSYCEGSRAACTSRRSLQIVERLGASQDFLAKGLPWAGGRSFYREQEVFRFTMPAQPGDKLPPMINIEQYYIEQYLHEAIERNNAAGGPRIELRWQSTVSGLHKAGDAHELEVTTPQGAYAMQADWVVACDGGQSFVRKQLGLALEGTAYEGRYVIIDILLPSKHPTERRAWFDPPWNRGSTVLMHRQPDDVWRIDYQLRHGEDTQEALQPHNVAAFVRKHLDAIGEGHLPWEPVWTSIYRAGAMTLGSYRHGRVLFAGNAAHAMPIFGVRGLNSGFDDADNLAWKLAWVVTGRAGDKLLDSYSSERIHAFRVNASNAMRSTEFMSPPSRGFDLMREAALSLAYEHTGVASLINPRQTDAITYEGSPLSSEGDTFAAGPVAGAVLADMPARKGHLTDRLGRGFTAFVFGEHAPQPDTDDLQWVCISPRETPGALHDDGSIAAAYDASPGSIVLVRPDGHVAARWRQFDAQRVRAAIARATAREEVTP